MSGAGEQVLVRVAHGHSADEAEQRLRDEDADGNFERVHAQARAAWAKLFDRVLSKFTIVAKRITT